MPPQTVDKSKSLRYFGEARSINVPDASIATSHTDICFRHSVSRSQTLSATLGGFMPPFQILSRKIFKA